MENHVPVRVVGGLLFELLGQSASDPYVDEDDIPVVLCSWQAQNFLITAMHMKGSASSINVMGITEVQVNSRGQAKDVAFEKIARRTPSFTGAALQNLMNEVVILAAIRDLKEISKDEIADALERIIVGPEKKNFVVSKYKKKLVAYHEAGHALVGALMPKYDPVAKISIIPHG